MAWEPLHVSAAAGAHLPPLLISTDFTKDAYTIYLSDLTSIWSESLSRGDIISRSRDENTSIDPSSSDQFQIFRDKIKLGLEGGRNTAAWLTVEADPSRPALILNVSVDLPGGLAPLEWHFRLTAGSSPLFTSQLVEPLLRAQHERMQEIISLAEVLKEKDHVIQKLLDKLESQGTELGQVFPQLANKVGRKVDRQKAAERVKSLAPFDIAAWRLELKREESRNTAQLINEIFESSTGAPALHAGTKRQEEESDEWWDNIKGITVELQTGKISTKGPSRGIRKSTPPKPTPQPALAKQESTIDDDDAFQVQATPPQSSAIVSPPKAVANDSTDDDDLDAPSQRSTQRSKIPDSYPRYTPPPKAPSPKPAKKFGNLKGKKVAPALNPPAQNEDTTDDDEPIPPSESKKTAPSTASGTDDESKSPPKARSPRPEPPTVKQQKRFGRIGGKKEPPPPPPAAESKTDDESKKVAAEPGPEPSPPPKAPTPAAAKPKKGKFGQIGKKNKAADATPAPEPEIAESSTATPGVKRKLGDLKHGSSPAKAVKPEPSSQKTDEEIPTRGRALEREVTPPPREDSEEKANRRRAELQRELEEKAKAPPKKKRKF